MTSYLSENKAEILQNGDVHLAQVPVGMGSQEPFGGMRSVMVHFLHLSRSFI